MRYAGLPDAGTPEFEALSAPTELVVGRLYHTTWARKRGMVWRLLEVDGDSVKLETPKSRRVIYTQTKALLDTNRTMAGKLSEED